MNNRPTNSNERPLPQNALDARHLVVSLCKNGHFTEAEDAFVHLCQLIKFLPCDVPDDGGPPTSTKAKYSIIQIESFQKSISSLVRYAPTIQQALDYACFCLYKVPEPLRDEWLEIAQTINLIYLYRKLGGQTGRRKALELIKTGAEYGYALPSETPGPNYRRTFQEPYIVFISVAEQVLRQFQLGFSADMKSIVDLHSLHTSP